MEVLETTALTRRFDTLVAVNEVTFSIHEGEVFGLVGPNGAGKSTLIKMLTTLLPPTSGTANVNGKNIVREPAKVREQIGYVPQLVSVDGDLTARENLLVNASFYDVPWRERESRALKALEFMDLAPVRDKLAKEFSGGMVRRLEIAQSMLHHPKMLFLDEPTVGLDPVARSSVWKHILELRDEFGTTILLTTHLMDEVEGLCDRMAIMIQGKMEAVGTAAELKAATLGPTATLDEVFVYYAGATVEELGSLREASRMRRTARRLG